MTAKKYNLSDITGVDNLKNTVRMLVYGAPKSGKTTFAMNFAKKGFNIIVLDGDRGQASLRKMIRDDPNSDKWKNNILWLDLADKKIEINDIHHDVSYYKSLNQLLSGDFAYNITKQVPVKNQNEIEEKDIVIALNLRRLNADTIVIIDSWSALITSMTAEYPDDSNLFKTKENATNTLIAYKYRRDKADLILNKLLQLNTTSITIGHDEKDATKTDGQGNPTDGQIVLSSTSKSHGSVVYKYFNEVFYLSSNAQGGKNISTTQTEIGCFKVPASSTLLDSARSCVITDEIHSKMYNRLGITPINPQEFTDTSVSFFEGLNKIN